MGCGKSKSAKKAHQPAAEAQGAQPGADKGLLAPTEEKAADARPEPQADSSPAAGSNPLAESAAENDAPKPAVVKVEMISGRGLRNTDWIGESEPYCIVQLAGNDASKVQTITSKDYKEPKWNHVAEVSGYRAGDSLVFTVKDRDPLKDDILGKATLTQEQVKQGFAGELQLTEVGEGVQAFLNVKVEGTDPTLMGQAAVMVDGTKGFVAEKVEHAKEALDAAGEKMKEVANEIIEEARELDRTSGQNADEANVAIESSSQSVCCRC